MERVVIGFIPPIVGTEGTFNTFRLGRMYSKLRIGEDVFLMDERKKTVFGTAEVLDVTVGPLGALCAAFAHENHTQLAGDAFKASEELYRLLEKIYGPHIVNPNKIATVVKLRRTGSEDSGPQGQLQT